MAKYSSMFKAISPDMNTEQATDGLVSIMKAFDIGNDNPDDVLDGILSKVNKIGNTAATSNGEIVNMLQKSSSAMKEANNTLEQTIALETAAVEITRDDDSVGTAFKTLAMRIRGYDEEGELLDSSEYEQLKGAIADLTKTAKSPSGISLFTDADKTTFKSTYQLLKDISEIYSDLDDKTQAQLLEKLAGKRQGQILAATINNFKAAEKAMDDMANSAGSAEAEMAVIMDSVDYKANKLKETGTGIAQNLFDRGEMKTVLDFLTSLASILDKVTDKLGLFGTVGLGAGLFAGIKNFDKIKKTINTVGTAINEIKDIPFNTDNVIAYGASLEGLSAKQAQVVLSSKALSAEEKELALIAAGQITTNDMMSASMGQRAFIEAGITKEQFLQAVQAKELLMTEEGEIVATQILTKEKAEELIEYLGLNEVQAQKIMQNFAETGSNRVLTLSYETLTATIKGTTKALWTFLMTNPVGWAILAGVAIVGVAKAYDTYNKKQEEAIQKARELQEAYQKQSKETSDHIKSLKDQQKEFERLSKGVDDYGNNISLSSDEYDRYKSIVSEILGYSPDLIAGYDDEGNAIARKNGLIEQSIALMKEEQRQKLKELTSKDNTETLYKGAKKDYKEANRIVNNTDYAKGQTLLRATAYDKQGKLVTPTNGVNTNRFVALTDILGGMTGEKFSNFAPENTIQDSWERFEKFAEYLEKYRDVIGHNYDKIIEEITKDRTVESGITVLGLDDDQVDEFRAWIKQIYDDIDERQKQAHGMDDQFMLFAQSADSYDELSDAQKNFVTNYIKATGSIVDAEGNFLSKDEIYKKAEAYTKFAEKLATDENFKDARNKINDLFAIDKKALSAKDYEQQITEIIDYLQNEFELSNDDAKKLKIQFGIEFLSDGSTQTETLIKQVKDHLQDEFDDKVDTLTLDDLKLAAQFAVGEDTQLSWDELIYKIATAQLKAEQGLNLEAFDKQIDELQSAYSTLTKARDEYNKNGAYSLDTVQALLTLEPQYLAMLVSENGQLVINEQAMRNLVQAQLEEAKSKIYANGIAQLNALIEKKAGEAVEGAGKKRANAVANIEAETKAVGLNTEAELLNMATKAAGAKVSQEEIDEIVNNTINSAKALETAISSLDIDFSGAMSGFDDTNKKLKDTQKQLSDLDKKKNLDTIKHKFDAIEQSVEKLNNTMSLLDNTLDLISEDDHIGKIQTTTLQLDLARTKAGLLADEFNELQNTEYNSADAANELASRMKSVADEIADNQKNILEYGKNITQYYGDALKAVGALSKTQIDEATNLLDRNIKSLEEGGLIGLSFSLSPVATPQSAIEKQRQENKTLEEEMQAHYNAVENMQKIALDMQYQETMADYARQREELVKSLNEIKSTLGDNSTEIQGIEGDKNKKVAEAEKQSNKERLAEEKSFSDQSKGVINDLNNWMKTNPIVAPSLDKSAWEGLVTKAESYAQRVKDAFTGAGTVNALNLNKDSDISNLARGAFGNGRNALVEAARSQVGYKAGAGKYNKFSEFGVGYGYAYDSAEDWCNDFTSWAAVMAGLDDVIPIGAGTIDTAERFKKNLKSAKNYIPKIGDIAYYGSSDSIGGIYHVEIVSGFDENGKLITIGGNTSGGKVVERVRSDYPKFFGTYYNGTGKFSYDGIAGETYETEYIIDKKTGAVTEIDSPTLVDTDKQAVVGVEQSKKIKKHQYAKGTVDPMDIAKYIRSHYPEVTDNAIAGILGNIAYESSFDQFNKTVEAYGSGSSRLIARRGLFQLDDERIPNWSSIVASGDWTKQVDTVLAEGRYHNSGMGNSKKHNMWQYLTDSSLSAADIASKWDSLYERSDGKTRNQRMDKANEYLAQIKSLGLSVDANTSSMSTNVAAMARQDVATRVNEIITGNKQPDTATRESVEDSILEFIKNKLPEAEDTTNTLIEKFGALQQVTNEYNDTLETDRQRLLDSVGTDNYNAIRAEIGANAQAKTDAIIAAQVDYELVAVKDNFDRAKEAQKLADDYYNSLVADGASTQEISAAANVIAEIDKQLQEYSDTYVNTMQKLSETMLKTTTRELKAYDDRISWIDKSNNELERQVQNAATTTEKTELLNKQLANNVEKSQLLEQKMAKAHQGNEDLRHDSRYAEIFDTYDTYAWFDAEGNATAQYELDRLTMAPKTVTLLQALFPILQKNTQEWQAAKEESEQLANNTKGINKELTQTKIEIYTENLQRLNEIDDVRKGKQDAITSAMEKQHSLAQSLREEISNINAELDANKHHEQWLDEDTRKLIFNDEDYEAELKAINDIQAEANDAYLKYKSRISELGETEWYQEQKITDEYNKRMDVLNEQLQVEKDKLAVKKKELEYNNALKERDTRIIIGGRSVQVANPDTMYNLAKERSQAQSDLNNTLLKNSETEQERQSDRISQSINQEIETRNKMVDLIGKMSDAEQELFAATLPVIDELEVFKEALSPQNIPWLNSHSRDFRDDFVDMPELYKHGGYNQAHDYAGDYDIIEQLYKAGIISSSVYKAMRQQAENQHNWKRSTDVNTAQYPYTSNYGRVNYGTEYYGINDEDKWAREQAKEYSQLAYEINHGVGTQAQLDRIKELNDNNAKDNKYIANTLDTTLYTVNEDGIVVRDGQKIGLDDDSMQQVGDIARDVVQTVVDAMPKEGSIAHGDYSSAKPAQKVGEIAHGDYSKYASGTKYAKAGKALTDEEGYEFKLKQLGGKFRELEGGEMIFSHPQSANLFEFSQDPSNYIQEHIAKMNRQMASVVTNTDNRKSEVHNHFDIHDFDVNKPTNVDAFMGELLNKANGRYDVTKNIRN